MKQKRRPIIIKELETRYEKTTAIYNGTMERLRRINGGRPVTDKAAVVMLSQEIEAYRAHIEQLRGMNTKLLTEDIVRTDIFAKNVKRLLDEKCMNQRELADAAGVTEVAMSRYLNDGRMPKGPILYNMAKVLGVSIDDLFEEHPEEKAAGSGTQAEKEAGNILDQLIRDARWHSCEEAENEIHSGLYCRSNFVSAAVLRKEKRMGEDLILREEEPRRDCMTCKFEPVESDRYPCCECGIRCHYSPDYRRGEENG